MAAPYTITLNEFVDTVFLPESRDTRKPKAVGSFDSAYNNHWIRHGLGSERIQNITQEKVQALVGAVYKSLKGKTLSRRGKQGTGKLARNAQCFIHQILARAIKLKPGILPANPARSEHIDLDHIGENEQYSLDLVAARAVVKRLDGDGSTRPLWHS